MIVQYKNKTANKALLTIFALNVFISLWYGFWKYEGWNELKDALPILQQINLSRFHFLTPLLWYVLAAMSIQTLYTRYQNKIHRYILLIALIQAGYLFYKSDFIQEYKSHKISYAAFYAEKQFAAIKRFLDDIDPKYRVASLGIHPAIAQYNGFETIDGYLANYPLSYKNDFRRIISKELEKSDKLRKNFDHWGSKAYLFSSELGYNFIHRKSDDSTVSHLELNTTAMQDLGCSYILSAVTINNAEAVGLKLLKTFTDETSAWEIHLYRIM
jgi:hypothetical protein